MKTFFLFLSLLSLFVFNSHTNIAKCWTFQIYDLFIDPLAVSHSSMSTLANILYVDVCGCVNVMLVCVLLTVWQKTTSRRYCSERAMAIVGALSCISRKTMDLLAVSLIIATHSVSVVRRGYNASLHSPAKHTHRKCRYRQIYVNQLVLCSTQSHSLTLAQVNLCLAPIMPYKVNLYQKHKHNTLVSAHIFG